MIRNILQEIGYFSDQELVLFEQTVTKRPVRKGERVLSEGAVCQSVFYILSGAFYQYQAGEVQENIIDLHLEKEWMFNHTSLISQSPSKTSIRAFIESEVAVLSLYDLHALITFSKAFLQLGRLFNQDGTRTYLFDHLLSPAQKYSYIREVKPQITQVFPVKMIASYLKIAPETLSRIRAAR